MNVDILVEPKVLPGESVIDLDGGKKDDIFTEHEIISSRGSPERNIVIVEPEPSDINIKAVVPIVTKVPEDSKPLTLKSAGRVETSEERRLRVQVTWKHINVWPAGKTTCTSAPPEDDDQSKRLILNDVSGTVKPGQFLSIMGCSGAGKTTLLQLLSGKMFPSGLLQSGDILINEQPRDSIDYAKFTAFVQQDDILMENMSVRECLQFAANVKSPGTLEERTDHVLKLMEELELQGCADLRFGSDKIRKGEKKRASIGVELITNPALLFVDEPTTGMDSFTAKKIVETLHELARRGRTIIATIHQPSAEIFYHFDQLMILALGRVVFFNHVNEALDYFKRRGLPCPARMNPAEHFMKMLSAENFMHPNDTGDVMGKASKRYLACVEELHTYYESDENAFKCKVDEVAPEVTRLTEEKLAQIKYVAPWCTQFFALLKRASLNTIRSPQATVVRYITTVFVMIMGTALYYQISWDGYDAMQNRVGSRFYLVTFFFLEAIQNVVLVFPEERAVFLREQASSLYHVSAYFVAKITSELPYNLLVPLISILMVFWAWDLQSVHSYNFWASLLNGELSYLAALGYGLILGSVVSDRNVLISMQTLINLPILLLSGFFVKLTTSSHIMWLLQYISPCKYSMNVEMRVSSWNDLLE